MDLLAGLSEEARKLAMERFRLLQPHIENNEPLTLVARSAGIPYRTAHRLVSEYRRIGQPGVGKTLSARNYSRWDKIKQSDRWGSGPTECPMLDTVFYTPDVVNVPSSISSGIRYRRDTFRDLARRPLRLEKEEQLDSIRRRDEEHQADASNHA